MGKTRIGIIGCGGMARSHASRFAEVLDRIEVAAVVDIERDKAEAVAAVLYNAPIIETDYQQVFEHIDAALTLDADNASAHMLLANWHAAILNNAGFISRMVYGADEDEVFAHYAEAIRVVPTTLQIRVEYARTVLELDADAHATLAREHLNVALSLPIETAFEELLRIEATKLLDGLKNN